ncbi:hypothetical protein [Amycolatopsis sp. lyj-90]|uniref:hypothetical protein n=1 Tax=Amycolatopsis sp. lyj-90 TaxID=2789285 RepID=UPI003978B1BA
MATLNRERGRNGKLSELWRTRIVTVRSKDDLHSMTLGGCGELAEFVFNDAKYRKLSPAWSVSAILKPLQRGKGEGMAKVSELMGTVSASGLNLKAVVAGELDPQEVLISPLLEEIDEFDGTEPGKPGTREE